MKKGFSLLESLLGLFVFVLIILGSFEFFGTVQKVFFRLQAGQENRQAAWAALDKIRTDFALAGQGLVQPIRLGLVEGIVRDGETWVLVRANRTSKLAANPIAGRRELAIVDADKDLAGRILCLFDETKGEKALIQEAGGGIITLSSPLLNSYHAAGATVIVLQKTSLLWEASARVLRRKNDGASAQPLLEDVQAFDLAYDPATCLASAKLSLISSPEEFYEIQILAKNAALGKNP